MTFYRWREQYAGLEPNEARELKQLREENAKLKRLVADLSLDKALLQDVVNRPGFSTQPEVIQKILDHRACASDANAQQRAPPAKAPGRARSPAPLKFSSTPHEGC